MVGLCQDSVRTSVRTAKCALGATYHVTVFGGYSLVNLVHVLGHVDPKCRLEIHKSVALPLAAHRPSIHICVWLVWSSLTEANTAVLKHLLLLALNKLSSSSSYKPAPVSLFEDCPGTP